eukprot:jgi/Botrbrau1/17559/Bobra.0166s0007.1
MHNRSVNAENIVIKGVPEGTNNVIIRDFFLGGGGLPPLADKVVGIHRLGKGRPNSKRPRPLLIHFQDTYSRNLAFCYSWRLRPYQIEEDLTGVECPALSPKHKRKRCCDAIEASEAGHVDCLRLSTDSGNFLPFGSPDRTLAGEARRDQAWQAVSAACRGNHPRALRWLLASGWPTETEELAVGHLQDTGSPWEGVRGWDYPRPIQTLPVHELSLYRSAMQNRTSACLEVLLEAGCRSPWICAIAADEGKADFLALAAERGCPCPLWALPAAARSGNPGVVLALVEAWRSSTRASTFQRCHHENEHEWAKISIREAVHLGHAACLEALLHCFGKRWAVWGDPTVDSAVICAAEAGHVECLDIALRSGQTTSRCWRVAAIHAACLDYLRPRYSELLRRFALQVEARAGQIDMLKALHEQGYRWNGDEPCSAAKSGSVEALEYCLDHVQLRDWKGAMREAARSGSPGCVQVLFDRGFLQHSTSRTRSRMDSSWINPLEEVAFLFQERPIKHCSLPCLEIFLRNSSSLPDAMSAICFEACEGLELLRCLRERGVPFHPDTAADAAAAGRHESLRYALDNGAPWDEKMFVNAVISGSVECLQGAHLHACRVGGRDVLEALLHEAEGPPAPNLAVLQYVCKHMDADWAQKVLSATAKAVAVRIGRAQTSLGHAGDCAECVHPGYDTIFSLLHRAPRTRPPADPLPPWLRSLANDYAEEQSCGARAQKQVDWQVVLYVARKLATPLPAALQAVVAPRKARAAAFAGVLYRAGTLSREGRPVEVARLWDALADLPSDLRQRIASEALLVLPVLPKITWEAHQNLPVAGLPFHPVAPPYRAGILGLGWISVSILVGVVGREGGRAGPGEHVRLCA